MSTRKVAVTGYIEEPDHVDLMEIVGREERSVSWYVSKAVTEKLDRDIPTGERTE